MEERTNEVRKRRRAILLALVLLLVVSVAISFGLRLPIDPVAHRIATSEAPITGRNALPPPASQTLRHTSLNSSQATNSAPGSPRSRFERSKDLSRFVFEIKPLLDQYDPPALAAYAAARSECMALSLNPTFAETYRKYTERHIPGYMLDDYVERCGNLATSEKIDSAEIKKLYKKAATGGDMTALAQQFTAMAPALPADQASKLMRDIVESGDPYAISELSTILGSDNSSNLSSFAGSEMYADAWQLVACDLGMDCGPRSYIVRQMCLFGGICSPAGGGFREVLSRVVLSPQDFQNAEHAEALILQAIKNGKFESLVK